jgi:simple sugar transport system ATP-binding protein
VPTPIISIRGLHKWYSGVYALNGIDLDLEPGGLVGDKWAGKLTLIKVLSGIELADSGEIRVEGRPVALRSPKSAMRLGIETETVYQYNSLVPNMLVACNLFIGREPLTFSVAGGGIMDQRKRNCPAASARASPSPAPCTSSRRS